MGGLISDTKLDILRQLRSEPLHGYGLAAELNLSHGYIYTHLGELQEAGMIEVAEERDDGKDLSTYPERSVFGESLRRLTKVSEPPRYAGLTSNRRPPLVRSIVCVSLPALSPPPLRDLFA